MEGVTLDPIHPESIEFVDAGESSSEHHRIGIEDGDEPAQAAAEVVQKPVEGFTTFPITSTRPGHDLFHCQPSPVPLHESPLHP